MPTQCYIQYQADPGKHLFMIREYDRRWMQYIKADLQAGKRYFVEILVEPFGLHAFPVTRNSKDVTTETIKEWLHLKPIALDEEQGAVFAKSELNAVRKEMDIFRMGGIDPHVIETTDFR